MQRKKKVRTNEKKKNDGCGVDSFTGFYGSGSGCVKLCSNMGLVRRYCGVGKSHQMRCDAGGGTAREGWIRLPA